MTKTAFIRTTRDPRPGGTPNERIPKPTVASSTQVDARTPTALCEERFRVAHFEDVANSTALVGRMLIVGLRDTITDPVAQIAGLLECSIEEPIRKIGLILVGNEGRLYLPLVPLGFGPDAGVSDA